MTRKSIYSIISVIILTILFLFTPLNRMTISADAAVSSMQFMQSMPPVIILTRYSKTMAIGEEFGLIAIASNGKQPTFKSSKSSIASVNTYGRVTAKKAGTCKITTGTKSM